MAPGPAPGGVDPSRADVPRRVNPLDRDPYPYKCPHCPGDVGFDSTNRRGEHMLEVHPIGKLPDQETRGRGMAPVLELVKLGGPDLRSRGRRPG